MMKILFVSHTANFSKFNRPFMRWFKGQGWTVDYASAGEETVQDCDTHFTIPLARSPLSLRNLTAFFRLRRIIKKGNYAIIHAHTPTGGVITRLAARQARKHGTQVLYTAHGFHFFRGAPLLNWLVYYPIEKLCSYLTDDLITINTEDYALAQKKFHAERTHHIAGVGVDLARFHSVSPKQKQTLRQKHGYSPDDFILIYVAELNKNKNQPWLFHALQKSSNPHLRLLLVGHGDLASAYKQQVKDLGLSDRVDFLGYRQDVEELYQLSDVVVSASVREGLGLNLIEGMACGLPIICSDNRGHRDIVTNGRNGWRIDLADDQAFVDHVEQLANDRALCYEIGITNAAEAEMFSLPHAIKTMEAIYRLPPK